MSDCSAVQMMKEVDDVDGREKELRLLLRLTCGGE